MIAPWNETTLPTLLSNHELKDSMLMSMVYSSNAYRTKRIILKGKKAWEEREAK